MRSEIGEVVAERALALNGAEGAAILRIGKPFAHPEGDWVCAFQITGVGDDAVYEAYGVDSLQALTLCLEMARIHLDGLRRTHAITWLGDGDLGL
jgi:hypothetical protein